MKKTLFALLATIAMVACSNPNAYTIKCERSDIEGSMILVVDTTETVVMSENGVVEFSGEVAEPRFGILLNADHQPMVRFVVEPGEILITDEGCKGTPTNDAMARLNERLMSLFTKLYQEDITEEEAMAIQEQFLPIIDSTYDANTDNFMCVALLNEIMSQMSYEEMKAKIDKMSAEMQEHPYIAALKEQLEMISSLEKGGEYVDFEAASFDNAAAIKLSDLLAEGKYVLLDFWASWCAPCMGEVPFLQETYKKYGGDKFEILGFSLDNDAESWKKAAASMPWLHVSDLVGFGSPVASIYNVQSIPANFLIAPDGTIVEKNLRGASVEEAVATYVK